MIQNLSKMFCTVLVKSS